MIKGIKLVSIPVGDQDRALAFYTDKLGFRIVTDQPFDEKRRWIELGTPAGNTNLALFTPDGHEDRVGTFGPCTFFCDNVFQSYEEMKAKGVEFLGPPAKQPWGTFAIFKDSEGNQFVLSAR